MMPDDPAGQVSLAAVKRTLGAVAQEGDERSIQPTGRERAEQAPWRHGCPRTLDEFVGQDHVLGPGRLLRRAIQADQISSVVFYGPPGTGKTTLARVIANTTHSQFVTLNAVLDGVAQVREVVKAAQESRDLYGRRTILFVDEVHRWNKAQQDALLPWVENGTIIMVGATTENPWFSVNRALLSRSRVFQLTPLTADDLRTIAYAALADAERGYGQLNVEVAPDALEHLVQVSSGDARSLLNAIELAVETTPPDAQGVIHIDMAVAEESIQQRAVLYDREGDYHFDTISAFIKSLRGSDPDAALYWLAKMVYAGEEPRFIFRRMLILACEDVGLADPQALVVVQAAAEAFEQVGLPEGQFHLASAALYLATCPKSNSVMGFFDALETVKKERSTRFPGTSKTRAATRRALGTARAICILTPTAITGWHSSICPTHCRARCSITPARWGTSVSSAMRWRAAARPSLRPWCPKARETCSPTRRPIAPKSAGWRAPSTMPPATWG